MRRTLMKLFEEKIRRYVEDVSIDHFNKLLTVKFKNSIIVNIWSGEWRYIKRDKKKVMSLYVDGFKFVSYNERGVLMDIGVNTFLSRDRMSRKLIDLSEKHFN